MQEVTSTKISTATVFDQLRSGVLVDTSSQSRAFADFLGLSSQTGGQAALQSLGTQINNVLDQTVRTDALQNDAASTLASGSTVTQARQTMADSGLGAAKNSPVSREAFEEAKPVLAKAGLTDSEIADLSTRVQAGALTWGQLVQSLGSHMTGAKKAMSLSASETADMQSLFQRLGFAGNVAAQMAQSVAQGDGLKVLSSIQNKLSTMPDDTSLGLDKGELATFFKALRLPASAASKLTQLLGSESTVADMKAALASMSQAMQDQRAKTGASDAELAKGLAKVMEKDVAKSARDASQSTTQTGSDTSGGQVGFELKTKDKNDTGWFSQHEKNQQKTSDDVWKSFLSKVRADDSPGQSGALSGSQVGQTSAKDALEALAGKTAQAAGVQQGKAETAAPAKAYEKVAAPKVLDQVSEAMLKDLGQGRRQLTVQLDPENLGKVQVMLQVKGKEVAAVITAEDADTAAMLTANMENLRKTLEDQGLTVQNMEVQTGLASRQDQQAAFNAEQHNQAQERQELSRLFSQLRMLRGDAGELAPDVQNVDMQAILADHGLHLIA